MKKVPLILVFIFLLSSKAQANPPFGPTQQITKRYGFSFSASGVLSFFKVDTRHSEKAHALPGFGGMVRMEFYPTSNIHIQCGFELMTQACRFNTYYFRPGYSQFYDRSFGYTHTLRTFELYVPLMARIGFAPNENNSRTIFYVLGGYAPKIFLNSTTNIIENSTGKGVWGGSTELEYENHFVGLQTGNVMIAGMGLDKRRRMDEKFLTYEIIFRYNLSRFIYRGRIDTTDSNNLLIKNCCVSFQFGYRFK